MKRPKKEGNRHLLSAFTPETIRALNSMLINEELNEGSPCYLLQKKLCISDEQCGLKQITLLKEVGDKLPSKARQQQSYKGVERIVKCLSFLFIKCKSKHPARRTIASILNALPDDVTPCVKTFLTESLSHELQDEVNTKVGKDFHDAFKNAVETLMGFTENFPLAKDVIRNCFSEGIQFLLIGLQREAQCARLSPFIDVQSAAMVNCLSALKAVIALLHSANEYHLDENGPSSTQTRENSLNALCSIMEQAVVILQDSNFMLDCRSVAGMVVVSALKFLVSEDVLKSTVLIMLAEENRMSVLLAQVKKIIDARKTDEMSCCDAKMERKVLQVIKEQFCHEKYYSCQFSKLIICHGIITKLDSNVLHEEGSFANETDMDASEKHLIDGSKKIEEANSSAAVSMITGMNRDSLICCFEDLEIKTKSCADPCRAQSVEAVKLREGGGAEERDISNAKSHANNTSVFSSSVLNCLLDNCAVVKEKGITVYAFRAMYSWTVEALNHCKSLLDAGRLPLSSIYAPKRNVVARLIFALNNHLDHPVDAVRHQVRNSLENVIKIINLFPDSQSHTKVLLYDWLHGSLKSRSKCSSLICLSDYVSVEKFLEIRPNFPVELLDYLNDCDVASHICDLYVKCAKRSKSDIDADDTSTETWIRVWCEPVFKALSTSGPLKRSYIRDYIVPGLLKVLPRLVCLILERSRTLNEQEFYVIPSIVFLSSSQSIQECSRIQFSQQSMDHAEFWHGLVRMKYMELCLSHVDEQVRLDCLSLICDSNRTTEVLQRQDFHLLKLFVPLNMTSQSPKFRSQFVCCLKKAASRIIDHRKQMRKDNQSHDTSAETGDTSVSNQENDMGDCEAFLTWLLEFLLQCLHADACFPRRVTALEIMTTVLKVIMLENVEAKKTRVVASSESSRSTQLLFYSVVKRVFSKESIQTLIDCLYDTYDVNRSLANDLLLLLPSDIYAFNERELATLFEEAIALAYSPQPDTASTAPRILLFLANGNLRCDVYRAIVNRYGDLKHGTSSSECVYKTHMVMIGILAKKLEEQINLAEEGLSKAALHAPLHGTIHCIRELQVTVRIQDVSDKALWKGLIEELVRLCLLVTNIAGPVIQKSAPEGSLDTTEGHDNAMVSQLLEDTNNAGYGTRAYLSQILIVCCWRSMKEAVLLLGDIVSCNPMFPVPQDGEDDSYLPSESAAEQVSGGDQILSSRTAIEIGNVFVDILLYSRHIGAFELAYLGFVKVCSTFWRSQINLIQALPSNWIRDLTKTLQLDDPSTVLCSTRRSAGIPFFISAICSAEPQSCRMKTTEFVMKVLIEICQSAQHPDDSNKDFKTSQQVICLNILRAMFRDSKFGEAVFPFASDGLIIAIKGFASSIWAVRNACTLLFSALLSRVFGVKKFPMSGTEFFSRFSPLYPFMANEMEDVTSNFSDQNDRVCLHPSVFPLLMLLSNLYTSSMDGNDSKMKLSTFIPHVIRCGTSGVYKTRVMAARALKSIITPGQLIATLNSLISWLPGETNKRKVNHNSINGALLQIQHLLKGKLDDSNVPTSLKKEIINGPLVSLQKNLCLISSEEQCSLNKSCFIDIINCTVMVLADTDWKSLTDQTRNDLLYVVHACYTSASEALDVSETKNVHGLCLPKAIGHEMLRKAAIDFLLNFFEISRFPHVSVCDSEAVKILLISKLLKSDYYDVRKNVLKWLASEARTEIEDPTVVEILQQRLLWHEHEADCLAEICNVLARSSRSRTFPWASNGGEMLNCYQVWNRTVEKTGNFGKRESLTSGVQNLSLVLLSFLHTEILQADVEAKSVSISCVAEALELVTRSCQADEGPWSRMQAAKVAGDSVFLDFFTDKRWVDSQNVRLVFKYWRCLLDLLQDEDASIRTHIAGCIFPFIKVHSNGSEKSSNLPSGYCIQPSLAVQMTITAIARFYSEFSKQVCSFLLSIVIGKEEESASAVSENSESDNILRCDETPPAEKQVELAVIFEQSEANTFKEALTLGHFAFEELQNLVICNGLDLVDLPKSFVRYISQKVKEWIKDPKRFLGTSQLKTSCQLLMGILLLTSFEKRDDFSEIIEDLTLFHKKLRQYCDSNSVVMNVALQSHLRHIVWAYEL